MSGVNVEAAFGGGREGKGWQKTRPWRGVATSRPGASRMSSWTAQGLRGAGTRRGFRGGGRGAYHSLGSRPSSSPTVLQRTSSPPSTPNPPPPRPPHRTGLATTPATSPLQQRKLCRASFPPTLASSSIMSSTVSACTMPHRDCASRLPTPVEGPSTHTHAPTPPISMLSSPRF